MGLRELSDMLWRERQMLDLMSYKLEAERLVAASDPKWVAQAASEVDRSSQKLRLMEIERATLAAEVAVELGLDPLSTLDHLIDHLSDPWQGIMARHRAALIEAAGQVTLGSTGSALRMQGELLDARERLDFRGQRESR